MYTLFCRRDEMRFVGYDDSVLRVFVVSDESIITIITYICMYICRYTPQCIFCLHRVQFHTNKADMPSANDRRLVFRSDIRVVITHACLLMRYYYHTGEDSTTICCRTAHNASMKT